MSPKWRLKPRKKLGALKIFEKKLFFDQKLSNKIKYTH
jgi:hypothetical protein